MTCRTERSIGTQKICCFDWENLKNGMSRRESSFIFCWNKTAFFELRSTQANWINIFYNFVHNAVELSLKFFFDEKFIDILTWMRSKLTCTPRQSGCIRKLKHLQLNFQILISFSAKPSRPSSHPVDSVYSNWSWKSAWRQNEWWNRAVCSDSGLFRTQYKVLLRGYRAVICQRSHRHEASCVGHRERTRW